MTAPARIGRYAIVRRLGKSMTDVYLAIDTVENRKAALKLIKSGGDALTQLMLEAERRGAAIQKELRSLDPRVIEIYDFGDQDGYFFVAMQFVEGRNLAEVLAAECTIDPVRAATVALEICEQLAKFHTWQSTVVHGDIKPSNIHLGPNDTVRLLDFGIAKTLRPDHNATIHQFGSPGYCSPERLHRSQVDRQSDLWALGATLYEMLAGVPPYQAEDTRKLEALIRSKRPPRALAPGCPRALCAIVSKALAPNPARRYASAHDFQADLQAFLEHNPTVAETERRAAWSANATIEAAREMLRRATRARRALSAKLRVAGIAGWFATGMALSIGGIWGWQAWHAHRAAPPSQKPRAQVIRSAPQPEPLPVLYTAAADRILAAYRASSDPSLSHFDFPKAELYLDRAVQLGKNDPDTLGKLALARGYAAIERLSGGSYPPATAARMRLFARDEFAIAAKKLPQSPDPHLALARVYTYSLPDPRRALAELAAAQHLGAVLGPREIAERADAIKAAHPKPAKKQARRVTFRRRRWR